MIRVSVLMSVYNAEPYLRDSINSVLRQTFTDFEFVIVDDGSTDGSFGILKQYARHDNRIRLVRNAANLGLTLSLNKGLEVVCGEYIARQDGDDISLPQRLASQVGFLDEHPEVGVLGAWIRNFDRDGHQVDWQTPASDDLIRWSLLFGTCIAGPSTMTRRSLLGGNTVFRSEMVHAEDYDLWVRLSRKTRLANLPEVLYLRRIHNEMICHRHLKQQEETVKMVLQEAITRLLGEEVPKAIIAKLRRITLGESLEIPAELRSVSDLIMRLYKAFVAQSNLRAGERMQVAEDAARRLAQAAATHVERWPIEASRIMLRALRLNRRVLGRAYLAGIAHGVLNMVARRN